MKGMYMTALKKEELERLEREYGLDPEGLSYQHRCAQVAAAQKGIPYERPAKDIAKERKQAGSRYLNIKQSPLYGKRILITPMMTPDAKRNLAFDEKIGHEITVEEVNAGDRIYGASKEVDRMVGDYEIVFEDKSRPIYAKTTFPKIGTEISYTIGKDLCPVVRGNDGHVGYIWKFPTQCIQIGDTLIQLYGLKTIIESAYPELLYKEFRTEGNRVSHVQWIDGITPAVDIKYAHSVIREARRKALLNAKAGLE